MCLDGHILVIMRDKMVYKRHASVSACFCYLDVVSYISDVIPRFNVHTLSRYRTYIIKEMFVSERFFPRRNFLFSQYPKCIRPCFLLICLVSIHAFIYYWHCRKFCFVYGTELYPERDRFTRNLCELRHIEDNY